MTHKSKEVVVVMIIIFNYSISLIVAFIDSLVFIRA